MTEAEWPKCEDPRELGKEAMKSLRSSDRVCRLCVAAFWSWKAFQLTPKSRRLLLNQVAIVEEWAENGVRPKKRASYLRSCTCLNEDARIALNNTFHSNYPASLVPSALLRDIFGNPFRRVSVTKVSAKHVHFGVDWNDRVNFPARRL